MYEKRLTFSWNRQPSHLKGKPACPLFSRFPNTSPDGRERLIYQDIRLQANDLEPDVCHFFISSPANRRSIAEKKGRGLMERGYWLPPRAKHLAAYAGFYIDSETVYQANMDSG